MTALEPNDIAVLWVAAGGPQDAVVAAVAVALAESGGDPDYNAGGIFYGLYGIDVGYFTDLGLTLTTALDPDTNTRAALALSLGGTSWAPWGSAWADPDAQDDAASLPAPQAESAAGIVAQGFVAGPVTQGFTQAAPDPTPNLTQVSLAYAGWQTFVFQGAGAYYNQFAAYAAIIGEIPL